MKTLYESLSTSNIDDSKYNIFVICKPGFLDKAKDIIKIFKNHGWVLTRAKPKKLLLSEAKILYSTHKKEDWFDELCKYTCSGLTIGWIFTKDKPMSSKMFEETDKIKDLIRKKFGEDKMRNVIHSSDSLERLQIERGIYF